MKRWIPAIVVAGLLTVLIQYVRTPGPSQVPVAKTLAPVPPKPQVQSVMVQIAPGETLSTIFEPFGLPTNEIRAAALSIYDLAKIRTDRVITFKVLEGETTPHGISYPLDEDNTLKLFLTDTKWSAEKHTITYEVVEATREFQVERTFWGAATEAGLRARDIAGLAQVFEFDVDFNTEIRAGASVRMVVEELYHAGRLMKLGRPLAVQFRNADDEFTAIHHQSQDDSVSYYDPKGIARKKAFLRSPLTFSRVTSGFSLKRFHPVLKRRRPHYGVDFGAPTGTPIRATGSGVVTHAGTNGGHGRFVKIDHPGPYQSSYSHLHRIKVKRGQKIKQGQIIGTVGSTGLATGPHLHYQFWKNGRYVNPMTADLPRTQKLPANEKAQFEANRDQWLDFLNGQLPTIAMSDG